MLHILSTLGIMSIGGVENNVRLRFGAKSSRSLDECSIAFEQRLYVVFVLAPIELDLDAELLPSLSTISSPELPLTSPSMHSTKHSAYAGFPPILGWLTT